MLYAYDDDDDDDKVMTLAITIMMQVACHNVALITCSYRCRHDNSTPMYNK